MSPTVRPIEAGRVSSVETAATLQLVLHFQDSPSDVVDALLLSAFATGGQPWARGTLMGLGPGGVTGRLLLLHGPPVTGKTTALRALARQWRGWCQVDCVLDPERLFNDPSYLMEVAIGEQGDGERHWRLLVLEDCDEL